MAKTKYENYSKEQLIAKLEKLEKKGYGLVWEDKPEKIADRCEKELPVLVEDKKKEIKKDPEKPTHFIFEGDNYHTLYTLNFTHKKGIDVIYIDPPYNTGKTDKAGKTDFRYNDRFIKKEDRFRHSTWLSFMNKRLRLAKNLLKDTGIIAISIDDNEVFNLKLLCDKIFGELNHIGTVPTIMNLKGNQDQFGFAGTHEYTLFYAKVKSKATILEFDVEEDSDDLWSNDEKGPYKKGRGILADGKEKYREDREQMYFPLLIKDDKVSLIQEEEHSKIYDKNTDTFDDDFVKLLIEKYKNKGFEVVLPINSKNELLRWTWGYDHKFQTHIKDVIVTRTKNGITLNKKQRPKLGNLPSKKPKSVLYRPEYSSGNGTNQLKEILGYEAFNNPKPIELIKDILFLTGKKDAIILDFFAGSGTTGQAVIELNKMDEGQRQCILCTNNENNICEEVTYPRLQRVINGYNDVRGIPANLKYFKTDYVPIVLTDNDKRNLVAKSTELLCIA
ncbi:site-specific DNA-methyltransferase [Zunongwangia sp. F260]|uniref:site-specific DNA-methyltransferase (adenine-specific) n=1 Tax=Autumnicola lenta TaxID=3075593 RepID=A0ABU3CKS9_9FLAO|nr:site-specific DNA-methyltransferase [Zunongwangia sp. F260]MDT0646570.1 site-specific DNA-methyltransferase [Zunongwangia sp. F260]